MTHLEDEPERDSEQCGAAANQDTELAQAGTIHPNDSPFVEDATAGNEGVKADAFDRLDELIIKPGSRWSINASKALTLKLEKPSRQAILRVSPDPDDHIQVFLFKAKEDAPVSDGYYLVHQSMIQPMAKIGANPETYTLFSAIRRPDNTAFMIPARMPAGESPRADECAEAYLRAMALAQRTWIRVYWDRSLNDYVADEIMDDGSTPVFLKFTIPERLRKMFNSGRLIDNAEHPAFLKLKGVA